MQASIGLLTAITLCIAGTQPAQTQPAGVVNSFETSEQVAQMQAHGSAIRPIEARTAHGIQALEVTFQPDEWPQVRMATPEPWDWSAWEGLAIDITNPQDRPVTFGVRVDDDARADGIKHCRSATATIAPGATSTCVLNLRPSPMDVGMRGLPVQPGLTCLGMQPHGPIKTNHIVAWQLFMHRPSEPQKLIIDHVRLLGWTVPLKGIVDEFGQYAKAEWPGKLKDATQLKQRRETETAELNKPPVIPDRDRYGGWATGPRLKPTGFFRTETIEGKWWLITPEGHLFWSIGMDCVKSYAETITTGREYMFSRLPGPDESLASHFGEARGVHMGPVKDGRTFNFFTANLERKYGSEYADAWLDVSLTRLNGWGFNTVGNWSDSKLYGSGRFPYVATVRIQGQYARLSSGSDWWGPMHDPYDPKFVGAAEQAVRSVARLVKDDPWCLGYFVDNELSWGDTADEWRRYGLARSTLAESGTSPAKKAMIAQFQAKYGDIAELNKSWGTQFATWQTFEGPWKAPHPLPERMRSDLGVFTRELAARYFRVVRDALRTHAPHHLYLGCRFAWHTPEAVDAANELCDVVSINIYKPRLNAAEYPVLAQISKPCIIGEFHSGALDRGLFHGGLVPVGSQQERAAMYGEYVRSVLDHPLFVGCHWFQYVDQPLTGRSYDGENYNVGFVTVTDEPYPELVEAARSVHRDAYARRWGNTPPSR